MTKLYRIEEYTTVGWELAEPDARALPRELAEQKLNRLMEMGHNPDRLRVVVDVNLPDGSI